MNSVDLGNHFFVIRAPRASFFVNYLCWFENLVILTPNDPKYPQVTPTSKIQKVLSCPKLQLSYSKLWLVNYLTRYFENKPKPEDAHKTGSTVGKIWKNLLAKIFVRVFWSNDKFSEKSVFENRKFRGRFCWNRGESWQFVDQSLLLRMLFRALVSGIPEIPLFKATSDNNSWWGTWWPDSGEVTGLGVARVTSWRATSSHTDFPRGTRIC